MIDVFIDDDVVFVGVPRLFTRPLRLTAPEGFALVAAGRAAMQLPGADPEGPLGRGPRQARRRARRRRRRRRPADRARGRRRRSSTLRTAITTAERLHDRYWTPSRDEVTARTITPRRVFNDRGEWYVGRRRRPLRRAPDVPRRPHRVARAPTGEHDTVEPVPAAAAARPRLVRRRRAAPRDAAAARRRRAGSSSATRSTTSSSGAAARVDATFPVASERWLERLLRAPRAGRRGAQTGRVARPRAPTSPGGCWRATPRAASASRADRGRPRRARRGRRGGGAARPPSPGRR